MTQLTNLLNQLEKKPQSSSELGYYIALCRKIIALLDHDADLKIKQSVHASVYAQLAYALELSESGNRDENVVEAIALLQQALVWGSLQRHPQAWAENHSKLADLYLARTSPTEEDVQQAIIHYHQALQAYESLQLPDHWAFVHWQLGRLYQDYEELFGNAFEQYVTHYKQAITVFAPSVFPQESAALHSDLGKAYLSHMQGEHSENVEQALNHLEQALTIAYELDEATLIATLQCNMAMAYLDRIQGKRGENVERAGQLSLQALEIFTFDSYPEQWAGVMSLLARVSRHRVEGERVLNLEQAIAFSQHALQVLSKETFPEEWAVAITNLAAVYQERLLGDPAQNWEISIGLYREGLTVYTSTKFPLEWAKLQKNLAAAYLKRPSGNIADNCRQAITYAQHALTIFTPQTNPYEWSMTQNIMGSVLARSSGAEQIQQAIYHYQQALTVLTRDQYPDDWAMIQNNMGALFHFGVEIDLETAVSALKQSLTITTVELDPLAYRQAQRNLADIYFQQSDWEAAVRAYAEALHASDLLYQASSSSQARLATLKENRDWTSRSAYCLGKLGVWKTAVEVLEWGKARGLREEMALTEVQLSKAKPADREAFDNLCNQIQGMQTQLRQLGQYDQATYIRLASALETCRESLSHLVEDIRAYIPDFMPGASTYGEIAGTATHVCTPIVYLLVTTYGSLAILLLPGTESPVPIWLSEFDENALINILYDQDDFYGYLSAVTQGNVELLKQTLDAIWQPLCDKLMRPVAEKVRSYGYDTAILIATGQLQLLPLHALTQTIVGFTVSPSARMLKSALKSTNFRDHQSVKLLGVAAPTTKGQRSLPFAHQEVAAIASLFAQSRKMVLFGSDASLNAVSQHTKNSTHIHFACHGHFSVNQALDSALFLTGSDEITLRNLLDKKLDFSKAHLVTLSACETGIVDFQNVPDEAIGLSAGFLQAGVPAVISTLWAVDDLSTMLLMERFYHLHLQEKVAMSTALWQAQLWLRELTAKELTDRFGHEAKQLMTRLTKDEALAYWYRFERMDDRERPFAHPYYWAAFMVTGL